MILNVLKQNMMSNISINNVLQGQIIWTSVEIQKHMTHVPLKQLKTDQKWFISTGLIFYTTIILILHMTKAKGSKPSTAKLLL